MSLMTLLAITFWATCSLALANLIKNDEDLKNSTPLWKKVIYVAAAPSVLLVATAYYLCTKISEKGDHTDGNN